MNARLNRQHKTLWLGSSELAANSHLKLGMLTDTQGVYLNCNQAVPMLLSATHQGDLFTVHVIQQPDATLCEDILRDIDALIVHDLPLNMWIHFTELLPVLYINSRKETTGLLELPNVTVLDTDTPPHHLIQIIDLWQQLSLTHSMYRQINMDHEALVLERDDARLGLAMLGEQLVEISEHDDEASLLHERILALVSHEMRTPLNGIVGMAELMAQTTLDEEQSEEIRLIHHSAAKLADLVDRLLDYRSLNNARLTIRETDFDLYRCVENTIERLLPQTVGAGLVMYDLIENSTPRFVRGDAHILSKILTSLVSNAIKFTEEGQIVIHVACLPVVSESDYLEIKIQDTGIGIPEDKLESIFKPFGQIEDYHTRKHEGLGIGLNVARQMANGLDGEITVKSQVGKGSIFTLRVPLKKVSTRVEAGPSSWQILHNADVMIWSNNEMASNIISRQLIMAGCTPTHVTDTRQLQSHTQNIKSNHDNRRRILLMDERACGGKLDQKLSDLLHEHKICAICMTPPCTMPGSPHCTAPCQLRQATQTNYAQLQFKMMQTLANLCHPSVTYKNTNVPQQPTEAGVITS